MGMFVAWVSTPGWKNTFSALLFVAATTAVVLSQGVARSGEVELGDHRFTLPDGMVIERIAGPPQVMRPICADFDEAGRLYVADSSGSNARVQQQLEEKPHRIVRLEDTNGDGHFNHGVVFADQMMFPEGVLWHKGSLYVAAPPSIWKLTDTNGDGQADHREEWFEGKTLTGCANDLHGPYLGRDGWIYWCKGAFAEQTYPQPGKSPLVTRASHIFRRDPRTSFIEPVMTGGMDNPVELVFTPGGERIFSTTFLQHPEGGKRDGLIHAIYGGVYGKVHAVLDGHPRTGDIMPPLTHLGAAAPCGLALLESDRLGPGFQHNVLTCLFNMHKVTRHQLIQSGATFETIDEDLLVSDNIDFHPTDVLEDADGSLIVIDTGGWYKLCCPTSHLEKADVLGAIYRLRPAESKPLDDPRGRQIAWNSLTTEQLAHYLADTRFAVREQAIAAVSGRGAEATAAIQELLEHPRAEARRAAVWALCRIDAPEARQATLLALDDKDEEVRQAALHSIGLWRDSPTEVVVEKLLDVVRTGSAHNRRAACEALGRIGDSSVIPSLLQLASSDLDRGLEHSLIYALYEIGDVPALEKALAAVDRAALHAVLIPLDQLDPEALQPDQIVPLLDSAQPKLRETAVWIVDRHPAWIPELIGYLEQRIAMALSDERQMELENQLARFGQEARMRRFIARCLGNGDLPDENRRLVLRAIARLSLKEVPSSWSRELARLIQSDEPRMTEQAISTISSWRQLAERPEELTKSLLGVAAGEHWSDETRLSALLAAGPLSQVSSPLFDFMLERLDEEHPVSIRLRAAEVLASAPLSLAQLYLLTDKAAQLGPMELGRILSAFAQSTDEQLGKRLVHMLEQAPSIVSIPVPTLRSHLEEYGEEVQREAERLYALLDADAESQREHFEQLLDSLGEGDVRRGQAVFYGSKAACSACHAIGYLGGKIGPDLTRIGGIRSRPDLLESIVFPSASFVRSYEPVIVVTVRGQIYSGNVQEELENQIVLVLSADQTVTIPRDEIEEMRPGKTSIMPAGLDKQLTPQELADLLSFLENSK